MRSREIPKAAQAKHLLPLLNPKASTAISGLPAEDKDDIEVLTKTLLATVYETTKINMPQKHTGSTRSKLVIQQERP